jgi:type IV secretory pathway VirB10-like protein
MNRQILIVALFAAATAALGAQEASQSNPYQGVSNPPPDDTIVTTSTPKPKPPAAHPYAQQPVQAQQSAAKYAAKPADPSTPYMTTQSAVPGYRDGTDSGIVQVAQPTESAAQPALPTESVAQPVLRVRTDAGDPDGDIVHLAPLGPDELGEGTQIRVRLLHDLSSSLTAKGETFRSRVSADVLHGGNVMIPAGAEIDGRVVEVSTGHFGGHGSMMLRPETVILPNGSTYKLHAAVIETPMSHTEVGAEGVIKPGSRAKRNGIEYGGAVGAGVLTGAYLGGPAGALAGGLIGAGLVTTHLLVSHPQAHLSEGDVLVLTLTQNMRLEPAATHGE